MTPNCPPQSCCLCCNQEGEKSGGPHCPCWVQQHTAVAASQRSRSNHHLYGCLRNSLSTPTRPVIGTLETCCRNSSHFYCCACHQHQAAGRWPPTSLLPSKSWPWHFNFPVSAAPEGTQREVEKYAKCQSRLSSILSTRTVIVLWHWI